MVERPEVELEPVIADLPASLARECLRGRVERSALFLRMAVDKIEDAVRAWPRAVDECGPGDRALRRYARAETAESALFRQPSEVWQLASLHHGRRQTRIHAVDADDDDLHACGPRGAPGAANEVASDVAARGAGGRRGSGNPLERGAPADLYLRILCHGPTSVS